MSKLLALVEEKGSNKLCYRETGALLPADDLIDMFEESQRIAKLCKEFQSQLKEIIEQSGPLRSERLPGLILTIKERDGRPVINAAKAIPVLLNGYFSNDELKDFVAIPMGAMKKALESKTDSGNKKGRIEQLLKDLEQAGAIERGRPSCVLTMEAIS